MALTFGGANGDDITWTDSTAPYGSSARSNLVCGWYYPTSLTATRCLWSAGAVNRCAIATTTSEISLFVDRTTDSQHTTSGLGLAINQWHFIAVLGSFSDTGPVSTYRVWRGVGVQIPELVTVNTTTVGAGASVSSTIITIGNAGSAANNSFQGAIGRFAYIAATTANALCRNQTGAISPEDEYYIYEQVVLPIWRNELPTFFFTGTESNNGIQHSILDLDQLQSGTSFYVQTSRQGGTILTYGRTATASGVTASALRSSISSFAPLTMPALRRRR